jgi:hypothetical protein
MHGAKDYSQPDAAGSGSMEETMKEAEARAAATKARVDATNAEAGPKVEEVD